tara:strand:- start:3036 stop:3365 length:330 start_codon:yes stop_codon:yes gene_type:complete
MKNTIEGNKYANLHLYSDVNPYEIIEVRTPNRIVVREMDAEKDKSVKLEFHPGGFCGHVSNQEKQKWFYKSNDKYPLEVLRKHKDGFFWNNNGKFILNNEPIKFHDYNF